MKRSVWTIWVGLILGASGAAAQTGFYLPAAAPSSGQDEFRAADGTTCRSSMDGTKRVEVGTFGSGGRADSNQLYGMPAYYSSAPPTNAGVYGRFTMSLDAQPSRMDCNKLFELELERRRLEVELMKRSLVAADRKLDEIKAGDGNVSSKKSARFLRGSPPP